MIGDDPAWLSIPDMAELAGMSSSGMRRRLKRLERQHPGILIRTGGRWQINLRRLADATQPRGEAAEIDRFIHKLGVEVQRLRARIRALERHYAAEGGAGGDGSAGNGSAASCSE